MDGRRARGPSNGRRRQSPHAVARRDARGRRSRGRRGDGRSGREGRVRRRDGEMDERCFHLEVGRSRGAGRGRRDRRCRARAASSGRAWCGHELEVGGGLGAARSAARGSRRAESSLDPAPATSVSRVPAVRSQPDISLEIAALDEARTALRAGRSTEALGALDRYDAKFGKSGGLRVEATELRIEALLRSLKMN